MNAAPANPLRRRVPREVLEVGAGAVLLAGIFAFIYAATVKNRTAANSYDVIAIFARADGIAEDAPVRLGGLQVGRVAALDLHSDGRRAVMTMRINSGIEIPTDTAAAIISEGLLGGKYLDLRPGGDETNIKPGGEITYTQESILVEELLQKIIDQAKAERASAKKK